MTRFSLLFVLLLFVTFKSVAQSTLNSFADLVENLSPAVVSIASKTIIKEQSEQNIPRFPEGSPFDEFFREYFDQEQNRSPSQRPLYGLGSGFIIEKSGIVVTNNHVIAGANEITIIISSESISLDALDYDIIKDIEPGETIIIKENLIESKKIKKSYLRPCIFEWIYISRAESIIHNVSVYEARLKMGEYLAKKIKKEIDISTIDMIVPIPETSKPICLKISEILDIPYYECIIKNRYIDRTFIMENQMERKKNIKKKLGIVKNMIKGKNILIVDDSIVRGNTMLRIINILKKSNVKKIYVASASPIIKYQNYYGIDIPTKEELFSHKHNNIKEMEQFFGINKLIYQDINDVKSSITDLNPNIIDFEMCIFNGIYI